MAYTGLSFSSQPFVKGFVASLDDDTDYRIKLTSYTWRIHSQLIAQESDFFRKICQTASPSLATSLSSSSTANTSPWTESTTRIIELHDDEPWMIARMLQYFYYKQYDYDQNGLKGSSGRRNTNNLISNNPNTPDLSSVANSSIPIPLDRLMSSARRADPKTYESDKALDSKLTQANIDLHMYIIADKYGCPNLKTKILNNFIGHGKLGATELMSICGESEEIKEVIGRDFDLKRAVAGKVARCYRDTIVMGGMNMGIGAGMVSNMGGGVTVGGSASTGGGTSGTGSLKEREKERPMDEWLSGDPQLCLLAMEQMSAPTF